MSVVYWFRLSFTLHWVEVLYCGTSPFGHKVFIGSNQSPLFDLHCYYRVKSVSLVRCTRFLQGQISLPFSIYIVITRSNQSPWFDVQGFYRVKSVSPFRFTLLLDLLQGQISLPGSMYKVFTGSNHLSFSIYKVFTGSNLSPFFDLQCYNKVKSVTRFRFTRFWQGQIGLSSSIYKVFTGSNQSSFFDFRYFYNVEWFHPFSIYRVFTE